MRARIDVSEIEAQTKIRARYLRALENEEWELLPGPTFIKSFLRTYATALGLDGKALVEEYRLNYELPGEQEAQPISAQRRRARPSGEPGAPTGGGPSRGYMVTVGLIGLLIVVLVVGLLTRGSSPKKNSSENGASSHSGGTHTRHQAHSRPSGGANPAAADEVSVSLQATATVWVCLINGAQRKLIPGIDLQPGQTSGPYHAKRFDMTLGNASVALHVDGKLVTVPTSTHALGYQITPAGTTSLPPASQPTCA